MGSKVRHAKYGVGTILECEDDGEDSKLTISFPGYGRKKMVERLPGWKESEDKFTVHI